MRKYHFLKRIVSFCLVILLVCPVSFLSGCSDLSNAQISADLISYLQTQQYIRLYRYFTEEAKSKITLNELIARYDNIYQTLNINRSQYKLVHMESVSDTEANVHYTFTVESGKLGQIEFEMTAPLQMEDGKWKLNWSPAMILPGMDWEDSVRLYTVTGKRGEIFDVNGELLATNRHADTVYVDTSRVKDFETLVRLLAPVLQTTENYIRTKLKGFVENYNYSLEDPSAEEELPLPTPEPTAKPNFFRRIFGKSSAEPSPEPTPEAEPEETIRQQTIPIKVYQLNEMTPELREALEQIEGVGVDNEFLTTIRYYPYGRVLSQTLGYTASLTAEDLQDPRYANYPVDALVGKAGLEASYEDVLRSTPGYELVIEDKDGQTKTVLASLPCQDGKDLRLTIDINMQLEAELLLIQNCDEEMAGSIVVTDPLTGYIQAMASYPSYDPNIFSFPMESETWAELTDEKNMLPLFNRCTMALYPPGSTFKPFTAAIGLESQAITPEFEFTGHIEQNIWVPDDTRWVYPGIKRVMSTPGSLNLYNAMTYSDNIYFAYTAMEVGEEPFINFCKRLGFEEKMDFDLPLSTSKISNTGTFGTLRLLADSGYGQGELLISPVQMAALFGSLRNNGDIMQPRLVEQICETKGPIYQVVKTNPPEVWKGSVVDSSTLQTIAPMLRNVVEQGTGKAVEVKGLGICGKTGTAQIGNDKTREIAWFIGYTTEKYDRLVCVALEIPADKGQARYVISKEMLSYASLPSE